MAGGVGWGGRHAWGMGRGVGRRWWVETRAGRKVKRQIKLVFIGHIHRQGVEFFHHHACR